MDSDFRDTVANMPQSRNRLEDGRSEDDKMPRGMWKAAEASLGEIRMGKAERKRRKRKSREEAGEKGKEKRTEKRKDSRS